MLDLTDFNGAEFLLQVYDYANNITTYRITRTIGETTNEVAKVTMSEESVTLMKGSTYQLTAFVDPVYAVDRDVVWTSDAVDVATVDQNGVVTAVGVGTARIYAQSVADSSKEDYCKVTVLGADYTINGMLQDEDGNPMSFSWDLANDDTWSKVSDLDMYIGSAASAGGNNVYVIDSDTLATYEVNLSTGEILASGVADNPYWDFTTDKVFSGTVSAIYAYYFIPQQDPMNIQAYAADLRDALANYTGASYFVGVESAGLYYDDWDGCYAELYYALDNEGYLWMLEMTENGDFYLFNYYETDLMDRGAQFDISYEFAYTSLIAAADGTLFVSVFNGDTNEIYMLTPVLTPNGSVAEYSAMKVGDVGQDVWPAIITSVTANDAPAGQSAVNSVKPSAELKKAEVELEEIMIGKPAVGGLNSVAEYAPGVNAKSAAEAEEDQSTVVLDVTAKDENGTDVFSTNGVYIVYYNSENLTLDSVEVHADYESVYVDEEEGYVAIAYVSMAGIPAGSAAATLTFTVDQLADHEFVIMTAETNDALLEVEEEVVLSHKHVYGEWYVCEEATDLSAGEMRRDCICCDHYESRLIPVLPGADPVNPIIPVPGIPSEPSVDPDEPEQPSEPLEFTDVKEDAWYKEAVDYVTSNGLMIGTSEDEFSPAAIATRAMVWTMLARLNGVEVTGESQPWYAEALAWVTENGVSDGTMANSGITREQVYTMLWRVYGSPEYSCDLSAFTDTDKISDWARTAIEWAVGNGIMKGMGNDELNPKGETTRAMLAQIFANMDGKF